MSDDDLHQRSRLKRILVFDADNAAAFPTAGMMRDVLVRMKALDSELDALAPSQETATAQSKGGTVTLRGLMDAIHDDLVDLSEISQAVEDDHPEVRSLFRLPDNERAQNWMDAADAVPAKLTPHLAMFEEYGLEPTFLQDLSDDVAAYKAAFGGRSGDHQNRAGDTRDIEMKIVEGKKLVKKLDVFAGRRFKSDAALMGSWMEASTLGSGIKAHRAVPVPGPLPGQ